jgi:high-affinity Fe2+/Pb2+ permease
MKNKTGVIVGFILGLLLGFLVIVVLSHLHPEEDFAGITIVTLLIFGILFAFVASIIQDHFKKGKG